MAASKKAKKRNSEQQPSDTGGMRELPEQFKPQHDLIDELIEGLKSDIER